MIKPALVALALLATPATAATVVLDDIETQFPWFYNQLEQDYARGAIHQTFIDWRNFYISFPTDTLFVETNYTYGPVQYAFYFSYDGFGGYGIATYVPEPSTWALLLFGFAFVGLRAIWPGAAHE